MQNWLLGASIALTGPEASYGGQLLQALELALEDEGYPPRSLLVVDDGSAAAPARIAADQLVRDPRVLAVVGPMNSWTCEVQAPIYHRAGIVHLTPSASNPRLAEQGWDTFFRMCPDDLLQGTVLAMVAAHIIGARAAAAVHDNTSFAEPLARRFLEEARRLGLKDAGVTGVRMGDDQTYEQAAEAVGGWRTDVVLVVGLEEACRGAAVALRSAGVDAILLGTDAVKPTKALVTPGVNARGPYLTNSGTDARQQAREFHQRFIARYGRHDSIYTVETYDAARLLIGILRTPDNKDRERVRASVRSASYQGLSGPIAFTSSGERANPRIGVYRCDGDALTFLGDHHHLLAATR